MSCELSDLKCSKQVHEEEQLNNFRPYSISVEHLGFSSTICGKGAPYGFFWHSAGTMGNDLLESQLREPCVENAVTVLFTEPLLDNGWSSQENSVIDPLQLTTPVLRDNWLLGLRKASAMAETLCPMSLRPIESGRTPV